MFHHHELSRLLLILQKKRELVIPNSARHDIRIIYLKETIYEISFVIVYGKKRCYHPQNPGNLYCEKKINRKK